MSDFKPNDQLQSLINLASYKQIESIEVNGVCSDTGEITEQFPESFYFKDDITYEVSLISLSTSSFFPNLTEANNKFFYSEANSNIIKEINADTGAYEIKDIDHMVKNKLAIKKDEDSPINITLIGSTGKVVITLADGWKIYFDREKTWRKEVGFESKVLDKPINISDSLADIVPTQRIYLECDIIKGSYYKGKQSTILFSFDNKSGWGKILSFRPFPLEPKLLIRKIFNQIIFRFRDDKLNPVTFLKAPVCLTIEIKQL